MVEQKWMYVLRGTSESHSAWSERMRRDVADRLLCLEPSKLQLTVTEALPPRLCLFPFQAQPIAIFNVYSEKDDPSRFTEALTGASGSLSGYEVEEAYPVRYDKTWNDGEPTPAPILLTMLHKKAGISDDEYIRRWHDGHTPLSLEVHPLSYYQRNVIRKAVTVGAAPSDGIVIEACPTRTDLLSPARFFGGAIRMVPNMLRVARDINGFLDLRKIETFYATEYHVRS